MLYTEIRVYVDFTKDFYIPIIIGKASVNGDMSHLQGSYDAVVPGRVRTLPQTRE